MTSVVYERWYGAGDLLNIIDNRDCQYNKFLSDIEGKKKMIAATGANGIMEIRKAPEGEDVEYHLVFHSGLGLCGPVPLCGNGSRCTAAYACTHGLIPADKQQSFKFLAGDGVHEASCIVDEKSGEHFVRISMKDIKEVVRTPEGEWFANCGSAHLVKFVPEGSLTTLDILSEGRRLAADRAHLAPELCVIVNFVEDREEGVSCRCYDTGAGWEILACGTASTSIAVCHASYKGEVDGAQTKVIGWPGSQIVVGYTKQGDGYRNLSLQSKVHCQIKEMYMYD